MVSRGPAGVFADEVRPRLLAPSAELILDALPPLSPQTRFLEVQAGGAILSRALVDRIAGLGRLVAVDDDVDLAAGLPSMPRRAARAVASARALPFPDGCFDVVIANLALGEADDVVRCAELRRVVRAGGHLVGTAVIAGSFERLFDVVADLADGRRLEAVQAAVAAAREAAPTLEALRSVVEQAGLVVGQAGVEARLLGLYDGAALKEDALITGVLLKDILAVAPLAFIDAIAQGIDAWYKDGLAVVVRTAVITARPNKQPDPA